MVKQHSIALLPPFNKLIFKIYFTFSLLLASPNSSVFIAYLTPNLFLALCLSSQSLAYIVMSKATGISNITFPKMKPSFLPNVLLRVRQQK